MVRRAAITGAGSGIGQALAERFARAGYEILGIDRDAAAGERVERELRAAGAAARFVAVDLATAAGRAAALEALGPPGTGPPIDVVVHNAGTSSVGSFERADFAAARDVLELNLLAPILLTSALLRDGRIAPRGTLVFVSSLSRFTGYPGAAAYAASKDGIASWARSLRVALRPRAFHVLTVYPGPTRTAHARRFAPPGASEARRMPPAALAERVLRAVERRRSVLVPGVANRLFALAGHLAPRLTERVLARAFLDRLDGPAGRPSEPNSNQVGRHRPDETR